MTKRSVSSARTHILAADSLYHRFWRRTKQLCDDLELVHVCQRLRTVLAGKQRAALEHLREDAAGAPDIDSDVVLLPGEHDLWRAVVPRGHIARHLGVLNTRKAEVADLEVAVFIDQDVARFLVSVDAQDRGARRPRNART